MSYHNIYLKWQPEQIPWLFMWFFSFHDFIYFLQFPWLSMTVGTLHLSLAMHEQHRYGHPWPWRRSADYIHDNNNDVSRRFDLLKGGADYTQWNTVVHLQMHQSLSEFSQAYCSQFTKYSFISNIMYNINHMNVIIRISYRVNFFFMTPCRTGRLISCCFPQKWHFMTLGLYFFTGFWFRGPKLVNSNCIRNSCNLGHRSLVSTRSADTQL